MPESRVNISNLSPWQEFLRSKFPGKNAKFTTEQFLAAADEFFGPIPIPPGSQIIYQNAGGAEYIDPQGYRHQARRELNGLSPRAGQVQDNTDRPNILPPAGPVNQLPSQLAEYAKGLTAPVGLTQLSPEEEAYQSAIDARNQAALTQQFRDQSGQAIANLYANRTNQSSIAEDVLGRLGQYQGLLTAQAQADAAQRRLAARQFLTQAQQGRNEQLLDVLKALTGKQTQRDISGGQLGLGYKELGERGYEYDKDFELRQQMADLALAQARKSSDFFGNLAQGVASSLLSYGLGGLGKIPGLGGGHSLSGSGGYSYGGQYVGE